MYKKEDFRRCFFNPLAEDLNYEYPRLAVLLPHGIEDERFADSKSQTKMIRYVLALYDPKSPLVKDYPDLNSRKIEAARVAGYDIEAEREILDMVYSCDSEYLVQFIINFLRQIVQSRAWASIQADEQTFWEFVFRMLLPIRESKDKDDVSAVSLKTKLGSDKEDIGDRLERNWNRFLGDDEDLKKKVQIKKGFSPEDMAGVK